MKHLMFLFHIVSNEKMFDFIQQFYRHFSYEFPEEGQVAE